MFTKADKCARDDLEMSDKTAADVNPDKLLQGLGSTEFSYLEIHGNILTKDERRKQYVCMHRNRACQLHGNGLLIFVSTNRFKYLFLTSNWSICRTKPFNRSFYEPRLLLCSTKSFASGGHDSHFCPLKSESSVQCPKDVSTLGCILALDWVVVFVSSAEHLYRKSGRF